jgi:bifunctional oligoribonuclease and PAP phosphatase NrnA
MVENKDFDRAIELINSATNVLITSHTRPDGDACGSMKAMCDTLERLGKKVFPMLLSPLAEWYDFIFESRVPILGNDITQNQLGGGCFDDCDLVIIIDTDSFVQLPQFDEWLRKTDKKILVIDHHVTGDGLGSVGIIDSSAAAAGEIVYDLLKYAGWPITEKIAESLFVAIAADSGWFKFNNADARLFRNAADLINAGASPAEIYRKIYLNFSPERMKLMVRMLGSMQTHFDGRVAVQHIMRSDFDKTGATGKDTENLIDECQRISTIDVAVMFVELADGGFRCSLRSKGAVNVREIAQQNGGGGHAMASGVNMKGPLEKAKKTIMDAIGKQLKN